MPLSTKIQYATYEPGEFTEEKERTYEETIQLIESFPWEAQRDHLAVALTNPSVTIDRPEGDYLKLALYYQGKFVLHYLNTRSQLYTRSFTDYHDAYPIIQSFFNASPPDLAGFRMETTWPQHIANHFITYDFHFRTDLRSTLIYAFFGFVYTGFIVYMFISGAFFGHPSLGFHVCACAVALLILILWTRIVLLFINHYRNAAGKVLILSKGKNIFYYGDEKAPVAYDKNDIIQVLTYGRQGRYKNSTDHSRLTRVEIYFKNAGIVDISCLLMAQRDLIARLSPPVSQLETMIFPFIPPSASAPS